MRQEERLHAVRLLRKMAAGFCILLGIAVGMISLNGLFPGKMPQLAQLESHAGCFQELQNGICGSYRLVLMDGSVFQASPVELFSTEGFQSQVLPGDEICIYTEPGDETLIAAYLQDGTELHSPSASWRGRRFNAGLGFLLSVALLLMGRWFRNREKTAAIQS